MPIEFQQIPEAQLKQEALNAMRALHLQEDIISTFEKTGAIMMTKVPYEKATLLDDEANASVKDSLKYKTAYPFFVTRTKTYFGVVDNVLFIPSIPDDLEMTRDSFKTIVGYAADGPIKYPVKNIIVYCRNLEDDFCSEFGTISIAEVDGLLARVES